MVKSVIGYVHHVTKYANGNIEIGFYNKDNDSADTYSTKGCKLSKEIARTLAESLAHNIWAKIEFNAKGVATKVSVEEYDFEKDKLSLKDKLGKLVRTGG